ncbi:hypothetical protein pipiens_017815, partial [Culex pipiens pipiens]
KKKSGDTKEIANT